MTRARDVFINCPFDDQYRPLFDAITFAVIACGFRARSALEYSDATENRIDKLYRIIGEARLGIHDLSRTEVDESSQLPRFNMPLELGVFLGAKRFGDADQKRKNCLVLDREPHRFQQFISDLGGVDVTTHNNDTNDAIRAVRNWLQTASRRRTIPAAQLIIDSYNEFAAALPELAAETGANVTDLTFKDLGQFADAWSKARAA
ncbi:MAG TPA: hypothetical protein VIL42_01575 [Sphingomicrobium sp.]